VIYGQFFPQTGSSFTNDSLDGLFTGGSDHPETASVGEEVVSVNADGNGNLIGTSKDNSNGGSPQQNSITDMYTVSSNGRVVVTASGSQSVILYIVNSGAVLVIPVSSTDTNPKLDWLQQ